MPQLQMTTDEIAVIMDQLCSDAGLTMAPDAVPIPAAPQTVWSAVLAAQRLDTVEALVADDGRITYGELPALVEHAAGVLWEHGIRPGDRIAASLPNCNAITVAFLAAQRLNAIWVGVNQALTPRERDFILDNAGVRLFLTDDTTARGTSAADLPASVTAVVSLRGPDGDSRWPELLAGCATTVPPVPEPTPHQPAAIAYTSGTTGVPKGVVHSQRNMILPAVIQRNRGFLTTGTRSGQALPLTILNIVICGPVTTIVSGATTVAIPRNNAHSVATWCAQEQLDAVLMAPPTAYDLCHDATIGPEALESVKLPTCGGAMSSEALRDAFTEKFDRTFSVGYGMTEAPTSVVTEPLFSTPVPGACGKTAPHLDITVRDDDGNVLPTGADGEICIAAKTEGMWGGVYTPMLGYWKRREATESALGRGYYRSGDIGCIDEQGCWHIRGRATEMILRGGLNIYPAEVEQVISQHPAVRSACVLGRPDERLGEQVIAVVEPYPGQTVDAEEILQLCSRDLTRQKCPVEVHVVDALPRNQMDKIVRSQVKAAIDL